MSALVILDVQPLTHQGTHYFITFTCQQFHGHDPFDPATAVLETEKAADTAVFAVHSLGFDVQWCADPMIDRYRLFVGAAVLHRVIPSPGAI